MIGNSINTIISRSESFWLKGKSFSFSDYFSFANGEVKTIVFDPTACDCNNVEFETILFAATSGPILIDFYALTDADDDGTILASSNRSNSTVTANSVFRLNPTINNIGTRFSGDLIPSTGTAPSNSSGATVAGGLPFEINKNIKYAFQITNTDGNDTYVQIDLTFYEI